MENKKYVSGSIVSADLTTGQATELKEFYAAVIGWQVELMPLKDEGSEYNDFVMKDSDGNWAAGICHARGVNAGIPPQWIVYLNVADVEVAVQQCLAFGGKLVKESRGGDGNCIYALLEDPSGAVFGVTKA